MPHTVTLTIPEPVYENYQHKARTTNKPVKKVIEGIVCDDQPPPPSVDDAPEYLRADLKALERLDNKKLRRVAESRLAPAKQRKLSRLLDKNQAGTLTGKERRQLDDLAREGQRLTVIKAHAWVLLKWRGEAIPACHELRKRGQPV